MAAIPEALPAVVTVLLALGARRMVAVQRAGAAPAVGGNAGLRSPPSAPDKTGTLTQNRMHAELLLAARCALGARRPPAGAAPTPRPCAPPRCATTPLPAQTALTARLARRGWATPPETALVLAAHAGGLTEAQLDTRWPRVREQPFDSDRKRMTTFHRAARWFCGLHQGRARIRAARCTAHWTPEGAAALDTAKVLGTAQQLAAQGLRVMALARRSHARLPDTDDIDAVENQLELLGLIALIDPPRPEAQAAVRDCISAGITPLMITGDHPATARAIAHRLGIVRSADAPVLTGADLATLDDAALRAKVEQVQVYARVDPAQRIRIVEALQAQGHFVAMTGDGVNDAPALKRADIGVAMGQGGTDVAREASSLVLLDDNFATIVAAVREGRRIYDNIRKFLRYAMTGNSARSGPSALRRCLLLPIPLLPIHILWVNLVTDGLPGLALAAEPAERGIMQRPPRAPRESLFAHGIWAAHSWAWAC